MGGSGSGRHSTFSAKRTVEECLLLDVNKLARGGMIRATSYVHSLIWTNTRTGKQTASVGYTCTLSGGEWVFTLIYTTSRNGGEKQDVRLPIRLQVTRPNYGGERWWFTCPLVVGGRACERRVSKLYLPQGGLYFGCRHCHDLTYTSCQESHKYDGLWRRIAIDVGSTPEIVKAVMKRGF